MNNFLTMLYGAHMKFEVIYEDDDILVIDKPTGIIVYQEKPTKEKTLIYYLSEQFPYLKKAGKAPRYGIVHRLDKDTSGILLVAKNENVLKYLQKEFKERKPFKKYLALITGNLQQDFGKIETLIGRALKDRRKQKVYLPFEPQAQGKREAITEYKVLKRLSDYTLVEAIPKTGRKHQIRCHFAYLGHPITGDKLYGFKNQPLPADLKRHFLHANYLKITLPNGQKKEFESKLPKELNDVLEYLINYENKN